MSQFLCSSCDPSSIPKAQGVSLGRSSIGGSCFFQMLPWFVLAELQSSTHLLIKIWKEGSRSSKIQAAFSETAPTNLYEKIYVTYINILYVHIYNTWLFLMFNDNFQIFPYIFTYKSLKKLHPLQGPPSSHPMPWRWKAVAPLAVTLTEPTVSGLKVHWINQDLKDSRDLEDLDIQTSMATHPLKLRFVWYLDPNKTYLKLGGGFKYFWNFHP